MRKKPSKNGNGKKTPNRENKDKQKEKSPQTESKTPAYLLEPTEPITDNASVSRYVISYSNPETPEYLNRDLNNDDMVSGPLKKLITYGEKNPAFTAFLFTLISTVVLAIIRFVSFIAQAGYLQYFGLKSSFALFAEKSIVYYFVIAAAVTFALLVLTDLFSRLSIQIQMVIAWVLFSAIVFFTSIKEIIYPSKAMLIIVSVIAGLIITVYIFGIARLEIRLLNYARKKIEVTNKPKDKSAKQNDSKGYASIALGVLLIVLLLGAVYLIGYGFAGVANSFSSINDNLVIITENEKYYICEPYFIVENNLMVNAATGTQYTSTAAVTSSSIYTTETQTMIAGKYTSTDVQSSNTALTTTDTAISSISRNNSIYVIKDIQIYVPKDDARIVKKMPFSTHKALEYRQLSIEETEYIDGIIQENRKKEKDNDKEKEEE